jgi:hypothetical protein
MVVLLLLVSAGVVVGRRSGGDWWIEAGGTGRRCYAMRARSRTRGSEEGVVVASW